MHMPNSFYSDVIADIKAHNSCIDICRFFLGLNVHYSGQAIHAPSFIREGDSHKSFAVYDEQCWDFATGKGYDIFDLLMLAKGISFAQAFEEISGYPLKKYLPDFRPDNDPFIENVKRLEANINEWHNNLLSNQNCLDYLKDRGITRETILKMYLGFDPKQQRIIIPFFKNGKVHYYAGRDITGKNDPKYLYMPTAYGCHKIPFGLQSVKPGLKKSRKSKPFADIDNSDSTEYLKSSTLVLTEGLFDAAILIQDGWTCLASGGGHFGRSSQKLVLDTARMYDRVCLAYDNDEAGQNFQLKMGKWLLGEGISFVCAQIPKSYDTHVVKDINDYYLAGGSFFDLASTAEAGIVYCGSRLNTIKEVYEFVQGIAGYASAWDMEELFDRLAQRTQGSLAGVPDPKNPDTIDTRPLFTKAQLRGAFKAAGRHVTDKEFMRRVLKKHQLVYSIDGKFYEYNHRYWEQVSKETVKRYISQVIGERATESHCAAVLAMMKIELEDDTPFNAKNVVTFQNGVLLLDESDPDKRFVPHNPDFRCTFMEDFCLKISSRPQADDTWLALSKQVQVTHADDYSTRLHKSDFWKMLCVAFPAKSGALSTNPEWHMQGIPAPNEALIREVQKMCGYIYFSDNRLEKAFILMGKGGNGKSTFMQIIEEVVGTDFCTHLSPDRMASCFDKIVLKNSILNICHEAKPDVDGAEETMKAVVSGNPIMASYKGQDAINFKTRAKLLISANNPMEIKDVSYGFARRMCIIPFDAKIPEDRKDPDLLDKLRKEKALIFEWMYDGYLMLKHGERFIDTPEQLAKKEELQEFIDHTLTFVREYLVEGEYTETLDRFPGNGAVMPMRKFPTDRVMYQWYLKWCKETNTEPIPRHAALGRINEAIKEKCPEMKILKVTDNSTGRTRDTYIMPDFADKIETTEIYDEASQEAIRKVILAAKPEEKVTSQGTGIQDNSGTEIATVNQNSGSKQQASARSFSQRNLVNPECAGQERHKVTPSEDRGATDAPDIDMPDPDDYEALQRYYDLGR